MAKQSDSTSSSAANSSIANSSTDRIVRRVIGRANDASANSAVNNRTHNSTAHKAQSVPAATALEGASDAEQTHTTPKNNTASKNTDKKAANVADGSTRIGATLGPIRRLLKKPPKVLAVWAALLVSGGAIAYLNFSQNTPRSLSPAGTQLVPSNALATITVTTDELAWTKLRQFGTADSQEQFDSFLANWQARLFTANGYEFRRDIRPWIGDRVTLAVFGDRGNRQNRPPTSQNTNLANAARNLVLVVPIADPAKAKALLTPKTTTEKADPTDNTNSVDTTEPTNRSYKGIQIQTVGAESSDMPAMKSAVIGSSWLLLSNTEEGIEQAIDTYRGKRSLLDNDGYRKAATRVEAPQPRGKNFAQIYLNIPAATEAMAPPVGITNRPRGSLIPLQGSEGIVTTALIESDGIRFQGTSWLLPKNDLAYGQLRNEAGEMPRRMPGNALITMSGSNLQQSWEAFSKGKTSPPFFPDPQNLKAGLLTQTGLDIDQDIMPWAAGEFAIGLLPPIAPEVGDVETSSGSEENNASGNNASNNAQADSEDSGTPAIASAPLLMMVQTNDRAMAESVWSQIDDVMVNRYRYQLETQEFEGGSITEWISPFQGVQFSHGWLPGNVAFFAVGDGAAKAIAPTPNQPLSSTRLFQTLTSRTSTPNNGNFYIDLESINALGGVFPLPQIPTEGPTTAIQAIGLTSRLGDRTMNYDLYVKLAQTSRP